MDKATIYSYYDDSNKPNSPNNDSDTDTDDDLSTSSSFSNGPDESSTGSLEPSNLESDFNEVGAGSRKQQQI